MNENKVGIKKLDDDEEKRISLLICIQKGNKNSIIKKLCKVIKINWQYCAQIFRNG